MNDPRFRQALRRAVDALQLASDAEQEELNAVSCGAISIGGLGQVLRCSRNIDTLERCTNELQQMLDQPPGVDQPRALQLLSRPPWLGNDAA